MFYIYLKKKKRRRNEDLKPEEQMRIHLLASTASGEINNLN